MSTVISFATQKGRVGKTTMALLSASGMAGPVGAEAGSRQTFGLYAAGVSADFQRESDRIEPASHSGYIRAFCFLQ